jgi:hypothetical protein
MPKVLPPPRSGWLDVYNGRYSSRAMTRAEIGDVRATAQTHPLEILFILRNLSGYLRFFGSSLALLVAHGHVVRLLLVEADHSDIEQTWLDDMTAHSNFTVEVKDHFRGSRWYRPASEIRRSADYLRYLAPDFGDRPVYRQRSERRSPRLIRWLVALPGIRSNAGLTFLRGLLSVLDRTVPRPPAVARYVGRVDPDLLVLCDYGIAGSLHSAYLEAARARGIPGALCVASWDNLSTRQLIPVVPDRLVVWNERQVEEAVEIHGIPRTRIAVTGAQCFDHWFDWKPRPRRTFCERVGLDPDQPFVLWVGGALTPAERTESEYAREWLEQLRASDDESLRELGVLVRPHPLRLEQWLAVDFSDLSHVTRWPREGMTMPTNEEQRADYFDSIFHSSVVVGINSSAMIEAAIVGRPVLGILPEEFHASHVQTFHFSYVVESNGGVVRCVDTVAEHFAELAALLRGPEPGFAERNAEFVQRFVRPHGLDREATPIFVDTLEQLGRVRLQRERAPLWLPPARTALTVALSFLFAISALRRLALRTIRSVRYRSRLARDRFATRPDGSSWSG